MMKEKRLIIIFGPEACGKMTVGQELSKMLKYNLIVHNHIEYLAYNPPKGIDRNAVDNIAGAVCRGTAESGSEGIIYTIPWNFSSGYDAAFIERRIKDCAVMNSRVFYVELDASMKVRKFRNVTDNRLNHKQAIGPGYFSDQRLLRMEGNGIYTSTDEDLVRNNNYIYINTEKSSPTESACSIISKFGLLME